MNSPGQPTPVIVTKEHRRFVEFCDACRRYRYIGLCYGSPGVGKTLSARAYACWDRVEALNAKLIQELPVDSDILTCRTVVYTPSVVNSPRMVAQNVATLRRNLSTLVVSMQALVAGTVDSHQILLDKTDVTELIIVDEGDRLQTASLEQLRDIYDRHPIGLVFIGMPGIEKRLARYPQLYSRVGFVHHFKSLSSEEVRFILERKWPQRPFDMDDFTDAEALSAIIRVTSGNFRLLQRLLTQIERIMEINELSSVTKEVVEAARELLIIGS